MTSTELWTFLESKAQHRILSFWKCIVVIHVLPLAYDECHNEAVDVTWQRLHSVISAWLNTRLIDWVKYFTAVLTFTGCHTLYDRFYKSGQTYLWCNILKQDETWNNQWWPLWTKTMAISRKSQSLLWSSNNIQIYSI